MDITTELYDGKSLADLFAEIHKHTDTKRGQINQFILKLVQLIRTPEDAAVIGPVVQGFLEVNVKNDEHLVRIAQIAQRIVALGSKGSGGGVDSLLTAEEKQQLLKDVTTEIQHLQDEVGMTDDIFSGK